MCKPRAFRQHPVLTALMLFIDSLLLSMLLQCPPPEPGEKVLLQMCGELQQSCFRLTKMEHRSSRRHNYYVVHSQSGIFAAGREKFMLAD